MSLRSCTAAILPRWIVPPAGQCSAILPTYQSISAPAQSFPGQTALRTPGEHGMKLLHIDSSPLAGNSVSRELTRRIVAQWKATHPHTKVEHLDLAVDAPNHLNADSLGFRLGIGAEGLSDVQRRENEISERLVS